MEKTIKFYKLIDGIEAAFPNEDLQVKTSDFTYNATRMGGAPTITCTVMYPTCLDGMWSDDVYCVFNGEKYHIQRTPSSSHDNTDARYKHEISLVSDRVVLENVLFFDVADSTGSDNLRIAKSSAFSFFGTISEFVTKLNNSLAFSKIGYSVVLDEEETDGEGKLLSFSDAYITSALQQINTEFDKKYYFDGNVIHVGEYQSDIDHIFEYGADKSLLSVKKQNTNNKIVTRITGVGSSENIPYYYPNETEKGQISISVDGIDSSVITIANKRKLAASTDLGSPVKFEESNIYAAVDVKSMYADPSGSWIEDIPHPFSTNVISDSTYKVQAECRYHMLYEISVIKSGLVKLTFFGGASVNILDTTTGFIDVNATAQIPQGSGYVSKKYQPTVKNVDYGGGYGRGEFEIVVGQFNAGDNIKLWVDSSTAGWWNKTEELDYSILVDCTPYKDEEKTYKWVGSRKSSESIEDFGLVLNTTDSPQDYVGASFTVVRESYIEPFTNLMPKVARDNNWTERFYNAVDGQYTIDGEPVVFSNPYVEGRPFEHIENFEDIKPTIKGATYNSLRIDEFSAIEYDTNDNDETDDSGRYYHPYFFVRLRPLGFNLFEHAIDSGAMTLSMTTGLCGGCEFEVAVDDKTQMNTVQVDANGNLLRDELGNVKCGRPIYKNGDWVKEPVPTEYAGQDTTSDYVWIALKKDEKTFGHVMPNRSSSLVPSSGDNFVILNIDLPEKYITDAEEKLEEELIKFMVENNDEKFTFPFNISRIFFEENKDNLKDLNENSLIHVKYNGNVVDLFVSAISYKMTSSSPLPEISITSNDEIGITSNSIRSAISGISGSLANAQVEINKIKQNARPSISKIEDDTASGVVTFKKRQIFEKGLDSYEEIKVGESVRDGLVDGIGTLVTDKGIQTDNLEVRGSLKVLDLVASQIHSLDGYYYFSDTMQISKVEVTSVTQSGSSITSEEKTARIYFEKQYANDFLKFYPADILLSTSINVDNTSADVATSESGNAYRDISLQSWMEVLATSNSMGDELWCDVRIVDGGAVPREGSYVARRGNYNENSERTSSWCISVEEGRIVYYINQTSMKTQDYNYGLVLGRLPDIAPVRNAGAVGEVGVYAKYLLAQHLITVQYMGDVEYVTLDKGDWNTDAAGNGEYFYKEETNEDGKPIRITRTKVNHANAIWICKENDEGLDYTTQEPTILSEGSKWALLSGGDAVTEVIVEYTTTGKPDNPIDGYDTDGLSIGSDEVVWVTDQSECTYNALVPYMWKRTTTKTVSNPKGAIKVELIGVYGQTGLNAHLEVDGGNVIQVLCDSDLKSKGNNLFYKNVYFALDSVYIPVISAEILESSHSFITSNVELKGSPTYAYIGLDIPLGWKIEGDCWITFRLKAQDENNGEIMDYTRDVRFDFVPNMSEASLNIQTTPATVYIPVSEGKVSSNGTGNIKVSVIKGERLLTNTEYSIESATPSYHGNASGYLTTSVNGATVAVSYQEGQELSESDYATIDIELSNGLSSIVNVLQNISGRDAAGEDAYSAMLSPQQVVVKTDSNGQIYGNPSFTFVGSLFKGSDPNPVSDATIDTTLGVSDVVRSVNKEGNSLTVELNSTTRTEPINFSCTITSASENVSRQLTASITPVKDGGKGERGYNGAVQRVFMDKLIGGQMYCFHSDNSGDIGLRYQDALIIYHPDADSDYLTYLCKSTYTQDEDIDFTGMTLTEIANYMGQQSNWQSVSTNVSSAWFTHLFAKNANIRMLSGANIVMLADDGVTVNAGMGNAAVKEEVNGNEIGYHFWSGGTTGKTSNFSVDEHGKLIAKNAEVQGVIKANAMYSGKPIFPVTEKHILNPQTDESTLIFCAGSFVLPKASEYPSLSYKVINPALTRTGVQFVTFYLQGIDTFLDTDGSAVGNNTLLMGIGCIEITSVVFNERPYWVVVRNGEVDIAYSTT